LQRKNIRCTIESKFQEYKFGLSKFTSALYHNCPYSDILKHLTNNSELIFDEKKVLALFITEYLKIDDGVKFTKKDIQNAALWLKKEFPSEELKYFEHTNKVGEK
jgi:hypothetical protein